MRNSRGSFDFVDVPLSDSHLPGEGQKQGRLTAKSKLIIVVLATSALILGLIIGIAVVSKQKNDAVSKLSNVQNAQTNTIHHNATTTTITSTHHHTLTTVLPHKENINDQSFKLGDLVIDRNLSFVINGGNILKLKWKHSFATPSVIARNCSVDSKSNVCLEWKNDRRVNISILPEMLDDGTSLDCYDIEWTGLTDVFQSLTDCFDVTTAHWYGGYEDTHQYWPLEKNNMTLSPYVSNDAFKNAIGNVLERYFISSSGVGILVDNSTPLYFSLNQPINGQMCFTAKYDRYPYFNTNNAFPKLRYKVCNAKNVKDVHLKMFEAFLDKPVGMPNEDLFRYPIWSTWAQYHYNINQSTVLQFTEDVLANGFNCSQIEIDDNWTPHYGDFMFDEKKFPNATDMISQIKSQGCAVTAWVHPFFNSDGQFFKEANEGGYLLRQVGSDIPALTKWWDGNMTGVLDVSNQNAVKWYLDKLAKLKNETMLDSFKFDAGELSWLPNLYDATHMPANPCENYPAQYVDMAYNADPDRRQEVRSGYRTQKYPIFVRQIDKRSAWGHNNAFASIIPGVFTFGILNYPFVLPDMIGGNAYDGRFPDPELFVRWIQLNAFLPSMQLSIVPWDNRFNISEIDVLSISRKFAELHADISDTLIKFANISVHTGEPVIRPLWWIDAQDETALTCEDEYLVGDEYLVAPIMTKGARARDIFFPSGRWLDMLHGNETEPVYVGPKWVTNYTADIDELAYFKNTKYV